MVNLGEEFHRCEKEVGKSGGVFGLGFFKNTLSIWAERECIFCLDSSPKGNFTNVEEVKKPGSDFRFLTFYTSCGESGFSSGLKSLPVQPRFDRCKILFLMRV